MAKICVHCFVSGRVQGVFFRRETQAQSASRGLSGWVRNLSDGRVEVMICGEEAAVYAMQAWLWEGPSAAKVNNVESEVMSFEAFQQFEVRN
ncbi:MAG TPA: acylphosphatase [Gammaproteobacteria bacterium]|nr:acylphosphatase [Gammaproteobacteria bacterium]